MARAPTPPKKGEPKKGDQMAIIVRAPKDLIEAFDKAIELGFIPAKSRNEAIVRLMESFLNDIFFVIDAFDKAQQLAKSPKYQHSGLPPELLHLQLAMEIITQTPSAEGITARYQALIGTAFANSKNPELSELKAKLNSLLNQDEVDENE